MKKKALILTFSLVFFLFVGCETEEQSYSGEIVEESAEESVECLEDSGEDDYEDDQVDNNDLSKYLGKTVSAIEEDFGKNYDVHGIGGDGTIGSLFFEELDFGFMFVASLDGFPYDFNQPIKDIESREIKGLFILENSDYEYNGISTSDSLEDARMLFGEADYDELSQYDGLYTLTYLDFEQTDYLLTIKSDESKKGSIIEIEVIYNFGS